ncbi:uncharacterized protein LOC106067107 [Biomphalaria glabrata]|uniref:Uncharacterized protein LOC106067107 n=1 Tax=Biomphalaria glabrata TaxID=6526 RepID=A0A9W3B3I1_BIOGL|nr:uncharacterized protein LOC106067107 [Biomphalaria glabrata]
MDFTKISKYKVIYHQAHPTKDPFLQDYLTYLNAAQSVDSIQDVCEFNATYDAALHSVLVSKEKMLEASEKCPEVFHSINRVDSVTCPYQMTSCDHETFIQITEDYCDTKSMHSESGQLSCIYDVASGSDHYLTLLNMDKAVDNNYTFLFTCIAYRLVNQKTWFLSDSPMACQPGQMTDETQSLYNVSIIDSCPLAAEQTWIIALAVVIVAIVLATGLFLIVWFLCGGRDRCLGHRDKPSLTLTEAKKQLYGRKWSSAGSSRGGEGHYNISFEDVFSTQKDGRTQGQCYEGQRQRRSPGKSRRGFFGNDGEADTSELTEDTEGITHDGRSTAETQALEYEQFTQDLNELKCSGESNGLQRESTLISLPQDKTVGVLSDDGFHEDVDGEVDTSTENMDKNKIHATPQEHAQNHRKSRRKGDDQDMVNSETSEIDMSISQDVTWSAAKHRNVLGVSKNAGYIRKHRKYPGRTLLTSLSGQTLRHHAHGHNKTLVTGLHGLELQDTPFYSEYHDYTTLRSQMVRDGFWDDQNDYFSSLNRLNERDHSLSNIADIGVVQTSAKEQTSGADVTSCQTENKTNVASSGRITSKSIQTLTGVNSEDNNMQLDEKQTENLQQFSSEGKYEQAVNPASQNHDLLSKLYSKLQDFDDSKDEECGQGSQTYETKIPKDRREMSSALRRLLSTRLALESVGSEKYKFDVIKSSNYDATPRSLNPFEDFISQKFALKFRSHLKRSSQVQTMASRKGTKDGIIRPLPLQETSKKNAISDPTCQVDRGSFGWTYNLLKQPHFTPGLSTIASDRPAPQLKKWEMQDLNLRKLLEELYTEYKFMTRVIQSTTDSDKTEAEVCNKLEEGREYLLQRALFWLERSSSADSIESRSLAGRIHKQLDTLATTLQPDQHKKSGPS